MARKAVDPSKYDNAIFKVGKIRPMDFCKQIREGKFKTRTYEKLVAMVSSEIRDWFGNDVVKSKAAEITGRRLLSCCKLTLRGTKPVRSKGLRSGSPSFETVFSLGYEYCTWQMQAYGYEWQAGVGQKVSEKSNVSPVPDGVKEKLESGLAYEAIAEQYDVSKSLVGKWREELGLPPRKRGRKKKEES